MQVTRTNSQEDGLSDPLCESIQGFSHISGMPIFGYKDIVHPGLSMPFLVIYRYVFITKKKKNNEVSKESSVLGTHKLCDL